MLKVITNKLTVIRKILIFTANLIRYLVNKDKDIQEIVQMPKTNKKHNSL